MSIPADYDNFVAAQASLADPDFQSMQELNDWLEINNDARHDPRDSSVVLDALQDIGQLALDYALFIAFPVFEGLDNIIRLVMKLSTGVARVAIGPIVNGFGSAKEREQFDLATEITSSPQSLVLAIITAAAASSRGDSAAGTNQGALAGHVINDLEDLKEEINTLASSASDANKVVAAGKIMQQVAYGLKSSVNKMINSFPSEQNGSPVSVNSATNVSISPNFGDTTYTDNMANNVYNTFLRFLETPQSSQRDTFGTPSHYIWGDPQTGQYHFSNGKPSPGLNRYADLLPHYLGGTYPEEESDYNLDQIELLLIDSESAKSGSGLDVDPNYRQQ